MKILISNDDGVLAPGLSALAKALSELASVTVVAPEQDRSAVSNSLTVDLPLRITEQPNGFFSVNGTPTDSVHLAVTGWLKESPDMVVAGINAGANLGDDVLYSGTVAAATEGRFLGYPAMAVSLAAKGKDCIHYDSAAKVAQRLVRQMLESPLPKDTILNVNVPDIPFHEIKGFRIARLGHRHMAEHVISALDPKGREIFWIGPPGEEQDGGPGTDFHAISQGYVSITPLKTDLTDYNAMEGIERWANDHQKK